ncbi:MAG: translation elongation factor 4 [Candidatus Staskawiczbacteria bacterium]|jgi:GTP-binding protein LepA
MQENIRNFSIIAHIDHGKSTLADRLLELTNTIDKKKMMPQFLDSMDLEREKGITIKLKAIRMNYNFEDKDYILNLVDTPGHVDFSYEVSRSMEAVEGAVLLVDATQGIQAQTLANLELAKKQNLKIIPVVNKIDSPIAKVEETLEELSNLLDILPDEIIKISAKDGTNVLQVLETVIKEVPPPIESVKQDFRALIFDSEYDSFKGVIAYVRVVDGEINNGDKIELMATKALAEVKELGYLNPTFSAKDKIKAGDIGYIATGIKEPGKVTAGDTIIKLQTVATKGTVKPLPGYQEPKPMVFASLYPENPDDFDVLKVALGKLKLSDPALVFEQEMKEALGRGFNCGFLGTLHIEIISERLAREFGLDLVISVPSVVYRIFDQKGKETLIHSASDWPENPSTIKNTEEPWVSLEVIAPSNQMGKLMEILKSLKGNYVTTNYLSTERVIIIFETPLRGIIANLYDKIKTASQGYASMSYNLIGYRPGKLVKMEIWVAGHKEEAFSRVVAEDESYVEGKRMVEKLKDVLPPEQFSVALQAVIGGKVIARETIKAYMKDVAGYLYGGDITRKNKLRDKQKKGKKLMKQKGKVNVPTKAFLEVFRA